MNATPQPAGEIATWDLSDLYLGHDDPRINSDFEELTARARAFEDRYRGAISAGPEADLLRGAFEEYEAIQRLAARAQVFAHLLFESDTTKAEHGALMQRIRLACTALARHLIFFDLELGAMPAESAERLMLDEGLGKWRHYFEVERDRAKHHLSESEEKLAQELAVSGIAAFQRLFDETTARLRFQVQVGDELRDLGQSEALALLYDPDRSVRAAAASSVTRALQSNSHLLGYIFNTLLQHKATMDRLRGYPSPEAARHQDNEIEPEVVERVVEAVAAGFPIVERYYRLKARLLGLEKLTHYDRYAPLFAVDTRIPWDEAKEMVLSAFEGFSPRMREMAAAFFEKQWIDAALRDGKGTGAFCTGVTPDLHPYVFMNYTGRPRDVMTLAHELGHGVHDVLAAGDNHYFDYHPSLPVAETASVFAEMLVFEKLQERITDPREKLGLLAGKIEDTMATAFRQISMYRFEQEAHRRLREEGEQPVESYNAIWQSSMQQMFGESLELEEGHQWWWLYIPHVFNIPFYVYAYACGELLVLSLYARYKQQGPEFVESYFALLAAGGSDRPSRLLERIGIDVRDEAFWRGGVELIGELVARAEELAAEAGLSAPQVPAG